MFDPLLPPSGEMLFVSKIFLLNFDQTLQHKNTRISCEYDLNYFTPRWIQMVVWGPRVAQIDPLSGPICGPWQTKKTLQLEN